MRNWIRIVICIVVLIVVVVSLIVILSRDYDARTLPIVVDCGCEDIVYQNVSGEYIYVTIQATDSCTLETGSPSMSTLFAYSSFIVGGDSYIPAGQLLTSLLIEDGKTITATFFVPGGGCITFECEGDEGDCSYIITDYYHY